MTLSTLMAGLPPQMSGLSVLFSPFAVDLPVVWSDPQPVGAITEVRWRELPGRIWADVSACLTWIG